MTKINLTLGEAVFLMKALENPKIKEMYDQLVKNYMSVSGADETEAKQLIFPEFLKAMKWLANK